MTSYKTFAVLLTTVAALSGCAGGGGGGSSGGISKDDPAFAIACAVTIVVCFLADDGAASNSATQAPESATWSYTPPPRAVFTSWTDLERERATNVDGMSKIFYYGVRPDGSSYYHEAWTGDVAANERFWVQYDSQGKPVYLDMRPTRSEGSESSVHRNHTSLVALGQPWLDVGRNDSLQQNPQSPFTTQAASEIQLIANPYALGWDYQSFGVWNQTGSGGGFGANTFGTPTAGWAVPTSGAATFRGKLAGLYTSPAGAGSVATADVALNVDFSARSLSFASSGTTITRNLAAANAAPNLDLRGTLTYHPQTSIFTGTLANSSGTLSGGSRGQFYGPAAQELGGVFTVKAPATAESLTGAYGAKR